MSKNKQHNSQYWRKAKKIENQTINFAKEYELYKELVPVLKEILKSGGGADNILKRSEPYAAVTIASLLHSDKPEVRMQAAKTIMERVSGKAVERSVNLNFDPTRLSGPDLDAQIAKLMRQLGPKAFAKEVLELPAPAKQKRKPNRPEVLEGEILDQQLKRPQSPTEGGAS